MMVRGINVALRRFVAKIALKNERISFLIPDPSYLNQFARKSRATLAVPVRDARLVQIVG
jgi:hypothetical protein